MLFISAKDGRIRMLDRICSNCHRDLAPGETECVDCEPCQYCHKRNCTCLSITQCKCGKFWDLNPDCTGLIREASAPGGGTSIDLWMLLEPASESIPRCPICSPHDRGRGELWPVTKGVAIVGGRPSDVHPFDRKG